MVYNIHTYIVNPRHMFISRILENQIDESLNNQKVLLLLGARQVGKTTLIEHILSKSSGDMLNMDVDVDRSRFLSASKLTPRDAVRTLSEGDLLIIDEAHRVPTIGRVTKGWYDSDVPVKIILLGSSSTALLKTAGAELVGRNEKLWLTPLLFREVLQSQKWFLPAFSPTQLHEGFQGQIDSLLLSRLVYGSYPEVFTTNAPKQCLTGLSSDYLLKDFFTSSLIRSPDDVKRLLILLAGEVGNTLSILQLATRLRMSRQTVQRYLDLLEGIFVIFSLPAYTTDPMREVNKMQKYYFWDTGIKNALQREWVESNSRSDISELWENWVMAEIFKLSKTFDRDEDLFFWQSRNGSTVDLVIKQGEKLHPFDMRFNVLDSSPSRSFESTYGIRPHTIHPGNVLEVLL